MHQSQMPVSGLTRANSSRHPGAKVNHSLFWTQPLTETHVYLTISVSDEDYKIWD